MKKTLGKFILFLSIIGVPMCLCTYLVSNILVIGYQHDTDPEKYEAEVIFKLLGIQRIYREYYPPDDNTLLPSGNGTAGRALITHYSPALGGINCAVYKNGVCVSKTSSGDPWEMWLDKGCACPSKYPFGTVFVVQGKAWTCVDRGGVINMIFNIIHLDLMMNQTPSFDGSVVDVTVYEPGSSVSSASGSSGKSQTKITLTYYYAGNQNWWQKNLSKVFKVLGLYPDDSMFVAKEIEESDDTTNDSAVETPSSVNCGDTSSPCLFPLAGSLSNYVMGTGSNGGLGCHTSGGPEVIKGWDFWTPDKSSGSVIYATHDGYVDWSGYDGAGNTVIQISNSNWMTTYMHMSQSYVHTGQKVTQGQKIGRVGNVGNSDWPHLHYAIYQKGVGPVCNQLSMFGQ